MFGSLGSLIHSSTRIIKNNLEKQYMKMYGNSHITNNGLYICLVKGLPIAKINGHKVNWTKRIIVVTQ
jgi:hypothetical protein